MEGYYRVVDKRGNVHEYDTRVSGLDDGFLLFSKEEEVAYLGSGGFVVGQKVKDITYFGSIAHHLVTLETSGQIVTVTCHPAKLSIVCPDWQMPKRTNDIRLDRSLAISVKRVLEGSARPRDFGIIEATKRFVRVTTLRLRQGQDGVSV
ncbi:MAG: hypothetical protein WCP14_02840 [bacterium]